VGLVSALQGLNNARFLVTGSVDMFSNELYSLKDGDNQKFAKNLVKWVTGESGVLRYTNLTHHKKGETEKLYEYKTEDDI